MIDYELAKELKDAGFSQTYRLGSAFYDEPGNHRDVFHVADDTLPKPDWTLIPTLEELIEACGDNILGLNRTHADDGMPNGWVADTHTHGCDCGKSDCFGFNWEHEAGSTPTEAVARLWLALNKKHD